MLGGGTMGAAPGAVLKPEQVVGRDELISDLWSILRSMSVALYSVRRMGKTSVLRKMAAEPAEGFMVDVADLEGTRSPEEFAKRVFVQVESRLGAIQRRLQHARTLL
jgi:hypothetical protein